MTERGGGRSVGRYVLLLFSLCIPVWVIGAAFDVQLFPGFKLFQAGLMMPMVASLLLTYHERGWAGTTALLRRTYDVGSIRPRIWFVPMLLAFPSFGLINYLTLRLTGAALPPPTVSLASVLGYIPVFFMTYAEELGLTGYAVDPLLARRSALSTGLILGLVWAGYHVPGFVISGFYSAEWIAWQALYTVMLRVLFIWIYNNAGRSLFSMALCHWTFGLFWSLWPQDNLQRAVPFYKPQIVAVAAAIYVLLVVYAWGPATLAHWRFTPRSAAATNA